MKKVVTAALLLVLSGTGLSACSSSGTAQAETPTPSPTPSFDFLAEMRSTKAFFGFDDAQLRQIGQTTCDALADGSSFDDLVDTLALNDFTKDQATMVIFASAREYCPQYER